jgi:hypothetical protein
MLSVLYEVDNRRLATGGRDIIDLTWTASGVLDKEHYKSKQTPEKGHEIKPKLAFANTPFFLHVNKYMRIVQNIRVGSHALHVESN